MNQNLNHICPLCGGPNECALAQTGGTDTQCWCHKATINPTTIVLAHRSLNNKSCICKRCATVTNTDLEIQQVKARLYSTESCHLCEEAEEIIRKAGSTATIIDIVEGEDLFEKYRTRIPVLQRIDNETELDWPFDTVAVSRFLAQRK
jgi:hypothetical protein